MKKQKFHFSISKVLFLIAAVLFSYAQPSFAQDDEEEDADTEQVDSEDEEADSEEASDDSSLGDAEHGEELFKANCASCHQRYKRSTGPALHGTLDRVPSIEWVYDWVHNSTAMVDAGDDYAVEIYEEYNGSAMTHFPSLSESDIDDILAYTEQPKPEASSSDSDGDSAAASSSSGDGSGVSSTLIMGILAFVLLLLVVVLGIINKTLRRFATEKGIELYDADKPKHKPIWKAIAENQFILVVFSIAFFLFGSYWVYSYMMQIGIDKGYEPVQPIHYSHRIHAGENDIDCKYCHAGARKSQVAGVPSLSTCMNCHKGISEVSEETATDEYSKEYYDNEIAKLYDAVGWDPETHQYTGETKPVKWVRVHNLPDFAYFNHSQHVEVGQLDCQKCHGKVEEMEILEQKEKLTMGWCVECHRDTDVKMEGNKYYEKIHKQLSKKYGVEKLTEAQMGGLECGRCHY